MHNRGILYAIIVVAAVAAAVPSTALAQGTITQGTVQFEYNSPIAGATAANADFRTGATDHVFQAWWWYRISGDGAETIFPTPDTQSYVGNVATLTWNNVNGRGFAAELVATVTDGGGGAGTTGLVLTLTPLAPPVGGEGIALDIEVFNYVDFDLAGSAAGDSATLINANDWIGISDGATTAQFRGIGAIAFQVTSFSGLRTLLTDGGITNLDNSGLPFGPADFTGAFQWSLQIPDQGQASILEVLSVNEAAFPVDRMNFSVE